MKSYSDREFDFIEVQTGFRFILMRFFYKLLRTPKPVGETVTIKNQFKFIFKILSARGFFYLVSRRRDFISWLTQYYPFSLLWTVKLYHFNNLKVRDLMNEMEKTAGKKGLNIILTGGGTYADYCEMNGIFTKQVRNKIKAMDKLEKCLQSVYNTLYVRNTERGFKLIVPSALIYPN